MTLTCLIVEDEPLARKLLTQYVEKVPGLELLAALASPLAALDFLKDNTPDVLFLDVQMPEITGIGLLKILRQKPIVVLTTAYSEYAIEGYELDVTDYLLKPITFTRFLKCVEKVRQIARPELPHPATPTSPAPAAAPDTLPPADSLALLDSLPTPNYFGSTRDYTASADSLTAPVDYSAKDSMWVDFESQEIHLYGDASVKYQAIDLKANHIVLNYGTNIVVAGPLPDSIGQPAGFPEFTDGGQSFTAKGMRYNFKSRKGIVYSTTTTHDDIYIRGGNSKFISGAVAVNDSTQADVIYTEGAIFTTCSDEHPHFGIRTRRAKIIPNKLAVIGPSNLDSSLIELLQQLVNRDFQYFGKLCDGNVSHVVLSAAEQSVLSFVPLQRTSAHGQP